MGTSHSQTATKEQERDQGGVVYLLETKGRGVELNTNTTTSRRRMNAGERLVGTHGWLAGLILNWWGRPRSQYEVEGCVKMRHRLIRHHTVVTVATAASL